MREPDPAHAATVAVGIPTGADDKIFRHARSELTLSRKISKQLSPLCPPIFQLLAPSSELRAPSFRAPEKLFRRKDLSPACRERNRERRCNQRPERTDSSQSLSCQSPE